MTKPVYYTLDDSILPVVRNGSQFGYTLDTNGLVKMVDRAFTDAEIQFIQHGMKHPLVRKLSSYDKEFNRLLTVDGYDTDDISAFLRSVSKMSKNSLHIKSQRFSDDAVRRIARGLDVIFRLSVFGKAENNVSALIDFRVKDNRLINVKMDETGGVLMSTGWLRPIWEESPRTPW